MLKLDAVFLFLLFLTYAALSYFGSLNPFSVGLVSSLSVSLLGLSVAFFLAIINRKLFIIYIIIFWVFTNLVVVGGWWYFQFFRTLFNYEVLNFSASGGDFFTIFSAFDYKKEAVFYSSITAFLSFLSIRFHCKNDFYSLGRVGFKFVCVFFSVVGFSSVQGFSEKLIGMSAFTLSPKYFHPVHAFFISSNVIYDKYEIKKHWLDFKQKNMREYTRGDSIQVEFGANEYNLIIIVVESFRASMLGSFGGEAKTPVFDYLKENYISVERFYANSNFTVKSEVSILCGVFDQGAKLSIAEYNVKNTLNCLPKYLEDKDYETYYFHGNTGKFYNRDIFFSDIGFSNLYFHADTDVYRKDDRLYLGWGVSDSDMYDIVFEQLESSTSKRPFFANLLTLTNHYPFSYEFNGRKPIQENSTSEVGSVIYSNYIKSIEYTDEMLGYFWSRFEESDFFDNTIVIITGDHGIWSFDDEHTPSLLKNEYFNRMPFVMYHPAINSPINIDQISSHIDILPTLIDVMDLPSKNDKYIGKNIFNAVVSPWSVSVLSGELFVSDGGKYCFLDGEECAKHQKECVNISDDLFAGGDQQPLVCIRHEGDLLGDRQLSSFTSVSDVAIYSDAFKMISYENHMLFEEPGVILNLNPE